MKINNKYFTDGALFDYVPIDKFDYDDKNEFYNSFPEKTLVVIFSDNDDTDYCSATRALGNKLYDKYNLYEPGFFIKNIRDYFPQILLGKTTKYHSLCRNETLDAIRNKYINTTLIIHNQNVKEHEFTKATKYFNELYTLSFIDSLLFMENKNLTSKFKNSKNLLRLYNTLLKIFNYETEKSFDFLSKITLNSIKCKLLTIAKSYIYDQDEYCDLIFQIYYLLYSNSKINSISKCFGKSIYSSDELLKTINETSTQEKYNIISLSTGGRLYNIHSLLKSTILDINN